MTKKTRPAVLPATPVGYPRKSIPCVASNDIDEHGRNYAGVLTAPEVAAHRVIAAAEPKALADEIDAPGMLAVLRGQATAVNRGDLTQAEAMLMNQATALQSLFARLAERAMTCGTLPQFEADMRLALRAQSQCRATLETLATVKNPPVVYARQANVTTGPQQINNGVAGLPREQKSQSEQNKLFDEIPVSGGGHGIGGGWCRR